jgi:transposase
MARPASLFADQPDVQEQVQLEQMWRHGSTHTLRSRAHAILLSSARHSIAELCDVLAITRPTATRWIQRWNSRRFEGLEDAPRASRPSALDQEQTQVAVELIKKYPRQPKRVLEELQQQTGQSISRRTLRRIAKRAGLTWKRARRSPAPPPDEDAVSQAKADILWLDARRQEGEIDLAAFDEARFTLQPAVPYAWQGAGERLEMPSRRGGGVSTLAFVFPDGETVPYATESTVDTEIVVTAMDDFCRRLRRETWLVIDNASPHTSAAFEAQEAEWGRQGLHFYFLPPRCPKLNWVEGLWDRIRYQWLPLDATKSLGRLWECVGDVLAGIGDVFHYHPGIPGTI